jgi:hypothetical protein
LGDIEETFELLISLSRIQLVIVAVTLFLSTLRNNAYVMQRQPLLGTNKLPISGRQLVSVLQASHLDKGKIQALHGCLLRKPTALVQVVL